MKFCKIKTSNSLNMKKLKQKTIDKMFRNADPNLQHINEEIESLRVEVEQLKEQLAVKQNLVFQTLREQYRRKPTNLPPAQKSENFVRPQKIILETSIQHLSKELEMMAMLSGTEVQSHVAGDHCTVIFHMQHPSEDEVKHGLRFDLKDGVSEISGSSLPLGFNLASVQEDFLTIMTPEFFGAVRKALVAYYNRMDQYSALKTLVSMDAQLFKTSDSSHVEITMLVENQIGEEEDLQVVLVLDYRVYDILPKSYTVRGTDPEAVEALKVQCGVFKRKPLRKAFKEVFIDGVGRYKMVQQTSATPEEDRRPKRLRTRNNNAQNDDTFLPEDCSEYGDEDDSS